MTAAEASAAWGEVDGDEAAQVDADATAEESIPEVSQTDPTTEDAPHTVEAAVS